MSSWWSPIVCLRLVLLHPVFGFWNAAQRLMPGLDWLSKHKAETDPDVDILAHIRELVHAKKLSLTIVACDMDLFANCDAWQSWSALYSIPLRRLSNPNHRTPYQQHFYARYDNNGSQWISSWVKNHMLMRQSNCCTSRTRPLSSAHPRQNRSDSRGQKILHGMRIRGRLSDVRDSSGIEVPRGHYIPDSENIPS